MPLRNKYKEGNGFFIEGLFKLIENECVNVKRILTIYQIDSYLIKSQQIVRTLNRIASNRSILNCIVPESYRSTYLFLQRRDAHP